MKHTSFFSSLAILYIWGASFCAVAEDTLITNVRMIDKESKDEGVIVNILIEGERLKLVSRKHIQPKPGMKVVDAQGGIVMGKLEVGGAANLIILDEDPRENFDVLLDTKTHATFAMHQGEVVKSRVPETTHVADSGGLRETAQSASEQSGWFAYEPPPIALPMSYGNVKPWNHWDNDWFSGAFLVGVMVDRTRWSADDSTESQVGSLDPFDRGDVRGLRFGVAGAIKFDKPWIYSFFGASTAFDRGFDITEDEGIGLFDYRLDIPTPGDTTLSIGKQKEPISMERLSGMIYLPLQERSAASDGLLPSRNLGAVLSGNAFDQRSSWAAGVFNDWLITSEGFNESASQGIGRFTWVPWASEDESNLVHLGAGIRYSNANEGIRYFSKPEISSAPAFVDTGMLPADDSFTWNLEASWRKGPFWLAAEYTQSDVSSELYSDPSFSGFHVTGSWILTGEMRDYNRNNGTFSPMPIARSVDVGGWGALEAAVRWSYLDLSEGGIDGGDMDILSIGLNWWLKRDLNFNINWRYIDLNRFDGSGESQSVVARLTFLIE